MDEAFAAVDRENADDESVANAADHCDSVGARDDDFGDDDNYSGWTDSADFVSATDCHSCCSCYCHSPKLLAVIDLAFVAVDDVFSTDYPIS